MYLAHGGQPSQFFLPAQSFPTTAGVAGTRAARVAHAVGAAAAVAANDGVAIDAS